MDKRKKVIAASAVILAVLAWLGAGVALQAHRNLVTLNVRNMDVRTVVRKIERQTWEKILVHKDVQGTVTLNVRRMPLEQVLKIVGDQTASRSSTLYPLYSSRHSLESFQRSVMGELDPAANGWTNLQSRGPFRGGPMPGNGPFGGGPFGPTPAPATQPITSASARTATRPSRAWSRRSLLSATRARTRVRS